MRDTVARLIQLWEKHCKPKRPEETAMIPPPTPLMVESPACHNRLPESSYRPAVAIFASRIAVTPYWRLEAAGMRMEMALCGTWLIYHETTNLHQFSRHIVDSARGVSFLARSFASREQMLW